MSDAPTITLFTTAICPYCVAAKNFLKARGREWVEVRVDTDPEQRRAMIERTGRTSVPQIFVGDTHVGGYEDLVALDRAGGLEALLAGDA
ncbi:MAG: glutaredoxin 3 [Proteobacteria bacterium]|nr:glutaredoxin 3 [Pseudomonadota bacterium]